MTTTVRVLLVTPEAHPLAKTGGLGDVCGALPAALRHLQVDARLLLPAYPGLISRIEGHPVTEPFTVLGAAPPVRVFQGTMPESDIPVYAIQCPALYERPGNPYVDANGQDWPDNALRFGVLSRLAAYFGRSGGFARWQPDVIHCNDWQTGLAPAYMAHDPATSARSLMSVHNMVFQGNFPRELMGPLELPPASFGMYGLEFYGRLSFLKGGLYYADHLTTVSPSYAREIQTPAFGYGMEGLLSSRANRLTGILNGIDTNAWDPFADPYLMHPYDAQDLSGKIGNKQALQEELGLDPDPSVPLLGIVSRMTWQKGTDLLLNVARDLVEQPAQLAVLGSGEHQYERRWRQLAAESPGRIAVTVGYDERLSHRIEAGADIFLMPSRFEPCGLNQMYSMRYGTPPVIRRTGGLADSVVDASPTHLAAGTATGFVFDEASDGGLMACVVRALLLWGDRGSWHRIQQAGMAADFSWERSAERYAEVYGRLIARPD